MLCLTKSERDFENDYPEIPQTYSNCSTMPAVANIMQFFSLMWHSVQAYLPYKFNVVYTPETRLSIHFSAFGLAGRVL